MEKVIKRITILAFCLMFINTSCDKTERATKKLIKEGRWEVTTLTAGSTEFTKLPKWQILPCADQSNLCDGVWEHQNGTTWNFNWRFKNIGGEFEFYTEELSDTIGNMAYSQCNNFSGIYKVKKRNSKMMHFESEKTQGYPEKLVTLIIERVQ